MTRLRQDSDMVCLWVTGILTGSFFTGAAVAGKASDRVALIVIGMICIVVAIAYLISDSLSKPGPATDASAEKKEVPLP